MAQSATLFETSAKEGAESPKSSKGCDVLGPMREVSASSMQCVVKNTFLEVVDTEEDGVVAGHNRTGADENGMKGLWQSMKSNRTARARSQPSKLPGHGSSRGASSMDSASDYSSVSGASSQNSPMNSPRGYPAGSSSGPAANGFHVLFNTRPGDSSHCSSSVGSDNASLQSGLQAGRAIAARVQPRGLPLGNCNGAAGAPSLDPEFDNIDEVPDERTAPPATKDIPAVPNLVRRSITALPGDAPCDDADESLGNAPPPAETSSGAGLVDSVESPEGAEGEGQGRSRRSRPRPPKSRRVHGKRLAEMLFRAESDEAREEAEEAFLQETEGDQVLYDYAMSVLQRLHIEARQLEAAGEDPSQVTVRLTAQP